MCHLQCSATRSGQGKRKEKQKQKQKQKQATKDEIKTKQSETRKSTPKTQPAGQLNCFACPYSVLTPAQRTPFPTFPPSLQLPPPQRHLPASSLKRRRCTHCGPTKCKLNEMLMEMSVSASASVSASMGTHTWCSLCSTRANKDNEGDFYWFHSMIIRLRATTASGAVRSALRGT